MRTCGPLFLGESWCRNRRRTDFRRRGRGRGRIGWVWKGMDRTSVDLRRRSRLYHGNDGLLRFFFFALFFVDGWRLGCDRVFSGGVSCMSKLYLTLAECLG